MVDSIYRITAITPWGKVNSLILRVFSFGIILKR